MCFGTLAAPPPWRHALVPVHASGPLELRTLVGRLLKLKQHDRRTTRGVCFWDTSPLNKSVNVFRAAHAASTPTPPPATPN